MPKAGCTSGPRSSNRLRAILSIFLAVAPLVCLAQAAHKVTAVRSWSAGDTTRVAVKDTQKKHHKHHKRNVIDNLETEPRQILMRRRD